MILYLYKLSILCVSSKEFLVDVDVDLDRSITGFYCRLIVIFADNLIRIHNVT